MLRDRAIVQLDAGNAAQAIADVEEGIACFRASPDTLGLAAMLRSAAQVRHQTGDNDGSRAALAEARTLTTDGANPLAEAGIYLIESQIADTPLDRLHLAQTAADLYREMGVTTGEATAMARVAEVYQASGAAADSIAAVRASAAAVRRARRQVSDPGRRADHDFAIRDVITDLLTVALSLGSVEAKKEAADLLIDAAPLGLRTTIKKGALDQPVVDLVDRALGLPTRLDGTQRHRHLLQQLGALLATVPTDQAPEDITFSDVAATHPDAALLVVGAPTRDRNVPIAWTLPGGATQLDQTYLAPDDVDAIDAIGYALAPDMARCLWDPAERAWQQNLTNLFLPGLLQDWLTVEGRDLVVYLPPVLSHVPIEALLIDGRPLGVLTAVSRMPVPGGQSRKPQTEQLVAYFDPHFPWTAEKSELDSWTHDEHAFRQSLARNSLIIAGCHGEQAIRAESALIATNGARVIDAFDLLARDLTGSVLVLEACYAGRYLGTRTGEQLSLATVGLLANSSAVVAAQFALPADENCTGVITATCLREIRAGTPPAEAMRRARAAFWHDPPSQLRRPGEAEALMPGDAPWAWAGLCVYGR